MKGVVVLGSIMAGILSILIGILLLTGPVDQPSLAPAQGWMMLNGGEPIDFGLDLAPMTSVIDQSFNINGQVYYTLKDINYRDYLFRFNTANKKMEVLDGGTWSSENEVYPESYSHAMLSFYDLGLFADPDNSEGLIGIASTYYGLGSGHHDNHGTTTSIKFDGQKFKQWNGGTDYKSYYVKPVITSWRTSANNLDFDFDPVTKKGIAIGTLSMASFQNPPYHRQLTVARYDHESSSNNWERWDNGDWIPNTAWPASSVVAGQPAWILNPSLEDASLSYKQQLNPEITHITNTQDYLVTFNTENGVVLASAIYRENGGNPYWSWWDGSSWVNGGSYDYYDIGGSDSLNYKEQQKLSNGKIILMYRSNNGFFYNEYNPELETWGPKNTILLSTQTTNFLSAVDNQDTIWIFYKDSNDDIYVTKKPLDSDWTTPELAYISEDRPILRGLEMNENNLPVLLFSERVDGRTRMLGITMDDAYWDDFTFLKNKPKQPSILSETSSIDWVATKSYDVENFEGDYSDVGHSAIDDEGHLYLPQANYFSNVIMTLGNDFSSASSSRWGYFADRFLFPSGVDVYEAKNTVYMTAGLTEGGGGSLQNLGYVTAWNYDPAIRDVREENLFWQQPKSTPLPYQAYSYGEQRFNYGAGWPSDVSVDDTNGLLIVTESSRNYLEIYDIENLVDNAGSETQNNIAREYFLVWRVGGLQSDKDKAMAIEDALIANGHVASFVDGGGAERIYWLDKTEQETRTFVEGLDEFNTLSNDIWRGRLLTELSSFYKNYHDRPVLLGTIGSEGSNLGQFKFPQGTAIGPNSELYVADSENHRIQKFEYNPLTRSYDPVLAFGSKGRNAGELFYPYGVSVDKQTGNVYVSDVNNDRIEVFDENGNFITLFNAWTENGGSEKTLPQLLGIVVSDDGYLYVPHSTTVAKFDITSINLITCGNGVINVGEECDYLAIGGQTCQDEGFDLGTLGCSSSCTFETSECSYFPASCSVDDDCDNGLFCDGMEYCVNNYCYSGLAECTGGGESCNEAEDMCDIDLTYCDDTTNCNDEFACNGFEVCDMTNHVCIPGPIFILDDFIDCTIEQCTEDGSLTDHIPDDSYCNDNDPCTVDFCDPFAHQDFYGQRVSGCVHSGVDDEIDCTIDSCSTEGVFHEPDDLLCDNDEISCTVGMCDISSGCSLVPNDNLCEAGEECDLINGCFPVTGMCGDGNVEDGEECDGTNLQGQTCEGLGYISGGTLGCKGFGGGGQSFPADTCTFDESLCDSTPIYSNFDGGTTNFANEGDLSNVADAFIEDLDYGSIDYFGNTINFNNLDLNTIILMGPGLISVDTSITNSEVLNVPARLSFYGITFNVPKILRNGIDCADCVEISYDEDVYVVDVLGFSTYELIEGNIDPEDPCSLCSAGQSCNENNVCVNDVTPQNRGGSPSGGSGGGNPQCSDGRDNDGDGKRDYPDDPGCASRQDNSELDVIELTQEDCIPDWDCNDWSNCVDGSHTRICNDVNSCDDLIGKPNEVENCEVIVLGNETITPEENGEGDSKGIVIGSIISVLALVGIGFVWFSYQKRKKNSDDS